MCQSHVAADGEAEISHLHLEGVREARQARLPRPSPGLGPCGLERRFHVEDDYIRRIVVQESIQVLRADGARLISDELPKPSFVTCLGLSVVVIVTGSCGIMFRNRVKTPNA
jgi:hypothetical protein